jgi:hypothetical protein
MQMRDTTALAITLAATLGATRFVESFLNRTRGKDPV